MKQFLITVAGVLVGLILFIIVVPFLLIGAISSAASSRHAEAAPGAVVLNLDMREPMTDAPMTSGFPFGQPSSVVEVVRKLKSASTDGKVKGLYIRAATSGVAPAHAEELADAIAAFRRSGKWVIAHVQDDAGAISMAGFGTVSGADEVWLHGAGQFPPMGLTSERTFFGDTLKKFHVTAQFEKREEFKTAPNTFTESGFTPSDRESTTGLVTSFYNRFVDMIAEGRKSQGLTPDTVRAAVEATPFSADEAVKRKLVDRLGTPEEAEEAALQRAGGAKKAGFVDVVDYNAKPPSGPTIALVAGEGAILTGPGDSSPFAGEASMSSDRVAQALLEAAEDSDVKAIVFRVSSPGGSAVASDQIWKAVKTAQARGKKVVVSMGAYAASGGYYVSAGADEIVAWPTTITGSIGVYGGKFVTGAAMEHYLDAKSDAISLGSPAANYFSSSKPFSNAEQAAMVGFIDGVYDRFVQVVSEGRGLTREETRAVAKGRVWTGLEAKDRKLVNTLGGLDVAVERAKALAGIKASDGVALKLYPEPKTPFEAIEEMFGVSAESARAAATLAAVMGDERVSSALRETMVDRRGVRAEADVAKVR